MSNRSTHLSHPPHKPDEAPAPEHSGGVIAILQVQPYEEGGVVVTSPAVDIDGRLDPVFTQGGDDISPALEWSSVIDAQSWAVIVQDPDAPKADAPLHWAVWDIPGGASGLPQGVEKRVRPVAPLGAVQGLNGRGEPGYMGPKPPPGHGVHRYHFQVFAVGKVLGLDPATTLVELVGALKGNTVASGELIASFELAGPLDGDGAARTGG